MVSICGIRTCIGSGGFGWVRWGVGGGLFGDGAWAGLGCGHFGDFLEVFGGSYGRFGFG